MDNQKEILVTSKILKSSGEELLAQQKKISTLLAETEEELPEVQKCFKGEGADAIERHLQEQLIACKESIDALLPLPGKLLAIAREYAEAERKNVDATK